MNKITVLYSFFIVFVFVFLCVLCNMPKIDIEDNFYVYLSNKNDNWFVSPLQIGNEPADFYCHLNQTLFLNHNYDVSLVGLRFRKTWINIPIEQYIEITNGTDSELMVLEAGQYENVDELLKSINNLIVHNKEEFKITKYPVFSIDPFSSRVQLRTGKCKFFSDDDYETDCFPILSQRLSEILGFVTKDDIRLTTENYREFLIAETWRKFVGYTIYQNQLGATTRFPSPKTLEALKKSDHYFKLHGTNIYDQSLVNYGDTKKSIIGDMIMDELEYKVFEALRKHDIDTLNFVNVFSDIVDPSHFGNKFEKILARVEVPTNKTFNQFVSVTVDSPVFHKVSHNEIDGIQIRITDDFGRLINFSKNTTVSVVLEFKKNDTRKPIYSILR